MHREGKGPPGQRVDFPAIGPVVHDVNIGFRYPAPDEPLFHVITESDNAVCVPPHAIGDCANCVPEGSDKPLPPRAQTAQQQADFMVKAVKSRLNGKAVPSFRFHDRGSLVALSDYKTFGVVFGGFRLEGLMAKLAYRSLHQQHLLALYGFGKFILLSLAALISRRAEPRIKLH